MSFESELNEGFAELAREAGTGADLSFAGVSLVGVLSSGAVEANGRPDTKMGNERRLTLDVGRSELAKLTRAPKVGEAFTHKGAKLRIIDIDDEDVTAPSVIYTVKK